jgi:hypothetical protein
MRRETWLPATAASADAARSIVREAATEAGLEGEQTWDLMLRQRARTRWSPAEKRGLVTFRDV